MKPVVESQEKVHEGEGDAHEEVRKVVGKGGQESVHHHHRQRLEGQEGLKMLKSRR